MSSSTTPPTPPAHPRSRPPPLPADLEPVATVATAARPRPTLADLVAFGHAEAARSSDGLRDAELRVRLAYLVWDSARDRKGARGWLAGVDHPAATALRRDLALADDDGAALSLVAQELLAHGDAAERAEVGELLIWRGGDLDRAIELLRGASDEGAAALDLALALAGRHKERRALAESTADARRLLDAAAIAQDREGDDAGAIALLERAQALVGDGDGADPTVRGYLLLRLLEASRGERRVERLRAKIALLGGDPQVEAERAATLLELALLLGESSDEAEAILRRLCDGASDFGPHLALHAHARAAAARKGWTAAADDWLALAAASEPSAWARACSRRAAEILEGRAGELVRAEAVWAGIADVDPADSTAAAALVRLRLQRRALAEATTTLEAHAGALVAGSRAALAAAAAAARAAEAAEARHTAESTLTGPQAIDRWRVIAEGKEAREPLEALVRAHRGVSDRDRLAADYRRLAAHVGARRAAVQLTVAGALLLDRGDLTAADDCFREAIGREPRDLLAHAGRALAARAAGKPRDLASALEKQVEITVDPSLRARLLRELAQVAAGELGDLQTAESSYGRALELQPDDPATLYELARLSGSLAKWDRAVELRERAARLADRGVGASWLCEVGDIHQRLGDDDRARAAYQRALELDGNSRPALAALAALHRKHRRLPELLDVLRSELRLAPDGPSQLALHLAIAAAADPAFTAWADDVETALTGYREALRLDPAHRDALAGLERLCRARGRWRELAEALSAVPSARTSAPLLRALGEACEQLGEWDRVAEAREAEVLLPAYEAQPEERAKIARGLADLYEQRLGDLDGAARAWHRVDEAVGDLDAVRALERIYASRGRFADLAGAIERELEHPLDAPRALALWLQLGEIRRTHLARAPLAAEAYEQALRLDPSHEAALSALSDLYARLDRPRDLERVIELRAAATTDPAQRAQLLLQKADILEKAGDLDGALAAFKASFQLDPSSRAAFTSLERVCYRRESWSEAMALYDLAIDLVEEKASRAYRLADLYARRGQVQLQYLGQPGEAAASYLRVLELDPDSDGAQAALERIFSAQSDWVGLISAYERRALLVADDGKRSDLLRRAARVAAVKLRDAKQAADLYQRLHAVDPTDGEALDALERHYEQHRDWDKLVDVLRTRIALTTGGDDAIKLYLRIASLCEEGMRSPERAVEAHRKILDIAPSHREALDALGRLYEGTEKWAELVEITRRQIRVVTDRAQKALLYFKCGSVMESKFGKDDDAIRYYDAAIRTSASCLPAVHGLRDLYLRREDWPRVIQSLELEAKLWTEEKERAGVLAHIGALYQEKLKDTERAIRYFENALAVDKGCLPANRSLFEIYFSRGDHARALPLGQVLTQKVMREGDPAERSEFYRKRAVVSRATGDLAGAAESLVVSLEVRPDNLDSLDLLVELCRKSGGVYDFATTFRELEKLYRKRDSARPLARVLVAQGALRERDFEIEAAEQLYLEALGLAADDWPVVEALVDLHVALRRFDAAATVIEVFIDRTDRLSSPLARGHARLRLAEVMGDCAMDFRRAAEALRALIAEQPEHQAAHFRLAQELYLLGGLPEALRVCERLIQLAAMPGATAPPEELARYYDYLGRIADAMGDGGGAARSYRRAVDLDPAYAPPVLALARRAAAGRDLAQAQHLLEEAQRAATERGPEAVLTIQRGTARFLVELGDQQRAVELYRHILAQAAGSGDGIADDRLALAELLERGGQLAQARDELHVVLADDLRHAPALRLLMQLYGRVGESDRAARVAAIFKLLGYAEATDGALPPFQARLRRGTLSEEARRRLLLPPSVFGPLTEALLTVREVLEKAWPYPGFVDLQPATDPAFRVCVVDVQRLLGVEAEVLLARAVPGGAVAFEAPRPTVVLEASLAQRGGPAADRELRFLLGRALEPLRGGTAMPLRLRPAERVELGNLLLALMRPEAERDPQTHEFVRQLPRKAARAVERVPSLLPPGSPPLTLDAVAEWFAALTVACDRAGLLACDDVTAAAATMARLGGEELAVAADGAVALGQVVGGADLVRFFLSDAYHELRASLGDPTNG